MEAQKEISGHFTVTGTPRELIEQFDALVVSPNYSSRSAEIRRLMAERVNRTEKEKV